jgi:hypothetical protein
MGPETLTSGAPVTERERRPSLPPHPFIYEINTWVWLDELGRRLGTEVGLGRLPEEESDAIAALGFDAVWLMAVWSEARPGRQSHSRTTCSSKAFAVRYPT